MAIWPCRELSSPFSSRVLTANTVLEKLSAKAISKAILRSTPENRASPVTPTQNSTTCAPKNPRIVR